MKKQPYVPVAFHDLPPDVRRSGEKRGFPGTEFGVVVEHGVYDRARQERGRAREARSC